MERIPLIVIEELIVLIALPSRVTLLNAVVPLIVCAAPLKITVPVAGLNAPLFVHAPVTDKLTGFTGSIVMEAPD